MLPDSGKLTNVIFFFPFSTNTLWNVASLIQKVKSPIFNMKSDIIVSFDVSNMLELI